MTFTLASRLAALLAAAAISLPAAAQSPPPPPPPGAPPPAPGYAPPTYNPTYQPPPPPPVSPLASQQGRGAQLTAFGGWQFNGDIVTYSGTLRIDDAASFGAAVDFPVANGSTIQLLYIYNSTTAQFASYNALYPSSQGFKVDSHYMQIGGTRGIRRGNTETFGGATLGAVLVIPGNIPLVNGSSVSAGDVWRFAITLGGGVKVHVSEKVALRFEGRMLMPMYFSGGGVYVGTGGAGLAVSAGVPAVQGVFTAGLTYSL